MSTGQADEAAQERAGVAYAGLAHVIWGVMPLYWRYVGEVSSIQLAAHRVMWCGVFVAIVTVARGHVARVLVAIRQPGVLKTLALTGVLISVNWTIYLYCIETGQLVEASLGYFINPLISFALGFVFFGERMSRLRLAAAALAVVAVIIKTVAVGHVSWIAPSLALTFAFYGYFRKRVPIAALDGLFVETALLFPFTLALLVWWGWRGEAHFPGAQPFRRRAADLRRAPDRDSIGPVLRRRAAGAHDHAGVPAICVAVDYTAFGCARLRRALYQAGHGDVWIYLGGACRRRL